jgi:poly(glycerol-phosphate) alpha-glucosyltransferase
MVTHRERPTSAVPSALPDVSCLIVTSRLRPGIDGGYTVATLQRALMFAEAGLPVTLLTVDLHPDYSTFRDEFRRLGLISEHVIMRNLLEEVRARPELLRDAADVQLEATIDQTAGVNRDVAELDATGQPWRQLVRSVEGAVVFTDFFDAEGCPLFRLPYLARPDWWRASVVIDVLNGDSASSFTRLGGLAGFRGLYRAWWDAVVTECLAVAPGRPVVAIAEARQVGELLIGTPDVRIVHTVHSAHTLPPHQWDSPLDTTWSGWLDTVGGYDAVVWLTHQQRDDVVRRRGREEAPGWVIPHPANIPADVTESPDRVVGKAHRDTRRAVMVARLAPPKRVDHAIRAWERVLHSLPDARLDIYGEGALRGELEELIAELGLGDRVALHGYTPDASEATRAAACLIVTSVYEGQSLVIAEAMARGCPVVAYDIRYGPAEMIVNGESGLLVPPADIDALADAVIGLMTDSERIDRFSRAAHAWAISAGAAGAIESWNDLLTAVALTSRAT